MYEVLKDFASPLVTLIASMVAGIITFIFARTQARIARSQRDIALDKLKFDLFQLRYGVYLAAKELLQYALHVGSERLTDHSKLDSLDIKLDEARFYFAPEICSVLHEISNHCREYLFQMSQDHYARIDADDKMLDHVARARTPLKKSLDSHFANLPKMFEPALEFSQLTAPKEQLHAADGPVRWWMLPRRPSQ